jgi:hypothetical protein
MAIDSFNKYLIVSVAGEILKNKWRMDLADGVVFIVISCHLAIVDIVIQHSVTQSIGNVPMNE